MFKVLKDFVIALTIMAVPSVAFSAEAQFHGLKTGMNKKEVIQYLQLDKIVNHKKRESSVLYRGKNDTQIMQQIIREGIPQNYLEKICQHKDFTNKRFANVFLDFTQDEILWRIAVSFYIPNDTLIKIALKTSIEKYFSGHEIKEESNTSGIVAMHYYVVTMVDNKISNSAIQKHIKSFLKEM
jgi:hypothetical protein